MASRKKQVTRKQGRNQPGKSSRAKAPSPRKALRHTRVKDVPELFRLNIEVGDLDAAARFYGTLLGMEARLQAGSRCYFTCGAVTLQVVDVSASARPHQAAKALYFSVRDLDALHARAITLQCLSDENVHGDPGGTIRVRPWGERSFYAQDPWGNPLCFVQAGTVYSG